MHYFSVETTRQIAEQHRRELLDEAKVRRIVRMLRRRAADGRPAAATCAPTPGARRRFVPLHSLASTSRPARSVVVPAVDDGSCLVRGGPDAA